MPAYLTKFLPFLRWFPYSGTTLQYRLYYYGMGQYSEAMQYFEKVMDYTRSGKIPYATLMIGNCQAAMGNKAAAVETYQKVISGFPTSPAAEKARAKLGKM